MKTKPIIFVVDDDLMFLSMLEDHLSSANSNYKVQGFTSGEACLAELHQKPHLIVLDYYLDNVKAGAKNGLEILKLIKAKEPDLPVIMLSGQEKYGVAAQTIMQGAVHYIMKDEEAFTKTSDLVASLLAEQVK